MPTVIQRKRQRKKRYRHIPDRRVPDGLEIQIHDRKLTELGLSLLRKAVPSENEKIVGDLIEVCDLGVKHVPPSYVHSEEIAFVLQDHARFNRLNSNILDKNFPHPTDVLNPGDRIHIRIYVHRQAKKPISNAKWIELLTKLKNVYEGTPIFPGAQGACLVIETSSNKIPSGFDCVSVDHEARAWKDEDDEYEPRQTCISSVLEGRMIKNGKNKKSNKTNDGLIDFGLGYVRRPTPGQAVISYMRL